MSGESQHAGNDKAACTMVYKQQQQQQLASFPRSVPHNTTRRRRVFKIGEECAADAVPGKHMCLTQHDMLVPLLPAVGLPEAHGTLLHTCPVQALSPGILKALHHSMDVHIMPS